MQDCVTDFINAHRVLADEDRKFRIEQVLDACVFTIHNYQWAEFPQHKFTKESGQTDEYRHLRIEEIQINTRTQLSILP